MPEPDRVSCAAASHTLSASEQQEFCTSTRNCSNGFRGRTAPQATSTCRLRKTWQAELTRDCREHGASWRGCTGCWKEQMSHQGRKSPATALDEVSDRLVRDIVDRLERCAQTDEVGLGDLLESFGAASFVSAIMVPAVLVVSPLSGIPFFSSLCGISIAFIAGQMLFKRSHLFLPEVVTRRTVPGDKLRVALKWMRRVADFLDRHTQKGRLGRFVGPRGRILPQSLCVMSGVLMPVLEIVPFSSSILGAAVLAFSIALLTRDGVFVLVGISILAAAGAVPFFVL
ncbi:exopolysaccharide biosynthesis protein [Roseovarius sp. D22-M7]|uniref:exopolysaccharide biosynthesis protein n=1 Tax=Roseovarius sp. D22-M7 TaxID=3127116 RepID=UPI003010485E